MAINVKLEGNGIVPHLIKTREMRQEAQRHFHFHSKLWRAIRDHILSKDCVLFKRDGVVATYAAGPGIGIEDFYTPFNSEGETQEMVFKIRVSYWDDANNGDNRSTHDEHYTICFPASLESKFTKAKFDLWISQKRRQHHSKEVSKDMATLQRLITAYPTHAVTMLPEGTYKVIKNNSALKQKPKRSRTKASR